MIKMKESPQVPPVIHITHRGNDDRGKAVTVGGAREALPTV